MFVLFFEIPPIIEFVYVELTCIFMITRMH
jgi:hypothetical protein